jgi:hypothetical protein
VDSTWNFKQVGKAADRCIDLAELRKNFCAIRFGDWSDHGIIRVIGYSLARLVQSV